MTFIMLSHILVYYSSLIRNRFYFNISYTEYGQDINNDSFFDYLTIELNIAAIEVGTYHIGGYLYDENDSFVSFVGNSSDLTNLSKLVALNFPGQDIWKARIMNGTYNSKRGMGMGLRGVKNLADTFEIETNKENGTHICVRKFLR